MSVLDTAHFGCHLLHSKNAQPPFRCFLSSTSLKSRDVEMSTKSGHDCASSSQKCHHLSRMSLLPKNQYKLCMEKRMPQAKTAGNYGVWGLQKVYTNDRCPKAWKVALGSRKRPSPRLAMSWPVVDFLTHHVTLWRCVNGRDVPVGCQQGSNGEG